MEGAYQPVWEGECEGYARRYMAAQVWRVKPDLDMDDLMQEANLFYLVCAARYKTNSPRHFMALFKTCLFNRVTYLAGRRTRNAAHVLAIANRAEDADLAELAGAADGGLAEADLRLLLCDAPDEVLAVVEACTAAPRPPRMRRRGRKRESTRAYLGRLAGAPPETDVRAALAAWLTGRNGAGAYS